LSREANGQFAKGNPGGPGRPPRRTEDEYMAELADVVTLEAWRQIAERAVADAAAGDKHARDWLSRYLVPDPTRVGSGHDGNMVHKIVIIRDENFYGNAKRVAAATTPEALAEREKKLEEFLLTKVEPQMAEMGLPPPDQDR
jgi:hypothetical protein